MKEEFQDFIGHTVCKAARSNFFSHRVKEEMILEELGRTHLQEQQFHVPGNAEPSLSPWGWSRDHSNNIYIRKVCALPFLPADQRVQCSHFSRACSQGFIMNCVRHCSWQIFSSEAKEVSGFEAFCPSNPCALLPSLLKAVLAITNKHKSLVSPRKGAQFNIAPVNSYTFL